MWTLSRAWYRSLVFVIALSSSDQNQSPLIRLKLLDSCFPKSIPLLIQCTAMWAPHYRVTRWKHAACVPIICKFVKLTWHFTGANICSNICCMFCCIVVSYVCCPAVLQCITTAGPPLLSWLSSPRNPPAPCPTSWTPSNDDDDDDLLGVDIHHPSPPTLSWHFNTSQVLNSILVIFNHGYYVILICLFSSLHHDEWHKVRRLWQRIQKHKNIACA